MPSYSQYVPNTPDGETIIIDAGKLALNKDDKSLIYGTGQGVTNKVYSPTVPIGCILAWAKSITGVPSLPDNFLECDGSVVSDADSPLDGETIPDLNTTELFLRGNTTSGGTGGATTSPHTHTIPAVGTWRTDSNGSWQVRNTATDSSSPSIIPPYMSVVWIIRIK